MAVTVESFVAEAWSYLAIALSIICLRMYARISLVGIRNLSWDEIFMTVAGIAYTAETTAAYFVAVKWQNMANNGLTDEQRAALDPNSEEWRLRVAGSKTHFAGWIAYTALFWLLKACWLFYYMRLTEGVRSMRIRIQIGWVLLGVTYLAALFMVIFKCYPVRKQWQLYPAPGNNCEPGTSRLQVSFVMAINTATDLYLMAIPLPLIYQSRIETKKKITLLVLFSGGLIVIIFGILRCITLIQAGSFRPSESGPWSVRESFLAVVISNFPMLFPMFQRWWRKAQGKDTKSSSMTPSYPLGSNPRNTRSNPRSKAFHNTSSLSMPNDTAWDSDEAIVVPNNSTAQHSHTQNAKAGNSEESIEMDKVTHRGEAKTVITSEERYASVRSHRTSHTNGITVVREYTVETESNH